MRAEDHPRFVAVMNGMAKIFDRELDAVMLDAYWLALRDWSINDFERAAMRLMGTSKFMPRPADFTDLRRAALPMTAAGEAWAKVLDHLKDGYRNGLGLTPEIDRAVKAMGGYRALAMMPVDQLPWQAKRFNDLYAEVRDGIEARTALARDPDNVVSLLERVRP